MLVGIFIDALVKFIVVTCIHQGARALLKVSLNALAPMIWPECMSAICPFVLVRV